MQYQHFLRSRRIRWILACIPLAVLLYIFRKALLQVLWLISGALILAFLTRPLSELYEKRLSRPFSALLSLISLGGIAAGAAWLVLPVMIREISELISVLPHSVELVSNALQQAGTWLRTHFGIQDIAGGFAGSSQTAIAGIAAGTVAFAGNIADMAGRFSLMVVLCFFFLVDRENLILRLELMIPRRHRAMAVCMGNAIVREMRIYLRGQALVAGAVALLATIGLLFLRVRSAIALGPIIGLLNMIPYFGPFIGGIPAFLIALADSWQKAGYTLLMIVAVQQIDNSIISPRVMGSVTGFSPAFVLIAIFAGSRIAGVAGMLFALPVIMAFRTLFRVFVQRRENI